MATVKRAVILAAGKGTRFLPATKAVPKELLPVLDRPLLQYAIEEATAAGINEFVIVDSEGKEAIRHFIEPDPELESFLEEHGKSDLIEKTRIGGGATFHFVRQDEQLGSADAVRYARPFVEGEPFALIFPDDLILGVSCIAELIDAYVEGSGGVIAVEEVPDEEVKQYGIVDLGGEEPPAPIRRLVEKPKLEDAPSRLGIVGRYIMGPDIFEHIDRIEPSRGELQVTDAFQRQIEHGSEVRAARFTGRRFDAGRPAGMALATLALALELDDAREPLRRALEGVL